MPTREPTGPFPWGKFPVEKLERLRALSKNSITDIEALIEAHGDAFTEAELKRLDKAVVLAKVGLKIIKKVVKARRATDEAEQPRAA